MSDKRKTTTLCRGGATVHWRNDQTSDTIPEVCIDLPDLVTDSDSSLSSSDDDSVDLERTTVIKANEVLKKCD
jgi:hypothetical protein